MTISHRQLNGSEVLDVTGAIRDSSVRTLVTAVREQFRAGHRIVVLNLERVPSVDLAGLAGLLEAHTALKDDGGLLRLAGVTRSIHDLVVITRLLTVFDTFDSVEDAVAGETLTCAAAAPPSALSREGLGIIQRFLRHV